MMASRQTLGQSLTRESVPKPLPRGHPAPSPSLPDSPARPKGLHPDDSPGPVHWSRFYLICGVPFRILCESVVGNVAAAEES